MLKIFLVSCLLAITAKTCFSLSWITKQVDKIKSQPRKCPYDGEIYDYCHLKTKRTFPKMWPKDVPIKYMFDHGNEKQRNLVREVIGFLYSEGIFITEVRDRREPVIIFRWVEGQFCGIEGKIGYLSDQRDQIIIMNPDCDNTPAIAHLLMHRLGFTHEINHPNRDEFVMIFEENLAEDDRKHFVKYDASEYQNLYEFDPKSVMQYHYNEFQEDALIPVIIPLIKDISPFDFLRVVWQNTTAPRQVFSFGDMMKLKDAFGKRVLPIPGGIQ